MLNLAVAPALWYNHNNIYSFLILLDAVVCPLRHVAKSPIPESWESSSGNAIFAPVQSSHRKNLDWVPVFL
jgi:hypothetical protein